MNQLATPAASVLNNDNSTLESKCEGKLKKCHYYPVLSVLLVIFYYMISLPTTSSMAFLPSLDFSEAIEDVDTVAPAQLLRNLKSLVISEKSGELVELRKGRGSEDWNWGINDEESKRANQILIESTDFHRDCGKEDKCPSTLADGEEDVGTTVAPRSRMDYKAKPYSCRCDPECFSYGDCCWNKTVGLPLRTENSLWSCKYIFEKDIWAMMISRCTSDSSSMDFLAKMCRATPGNIPDKNYTYLIDIPVYSRESKQLYRNIYCARCHREKNPDLVHWKTRLRCNEQMTSQQQQIFVEKAAYYPGERYFQLENRTCVISISDLMNDTIPLENTIPTIRYCGKSIDSCPDVAPSHHHDDDEVEETNIEVTDHDVRFCSSYTQQVTSTDGHIFKNAHCAKCNGVPLQSNNRTVPTVFKCYVIPQFSVYVKQKAPPPAHGPQGISLLFDFALDSDEVLVGYETLCGDDEIWDYIHRRCQMAICQKGYYLYDDACHPMLTPLDPTSGSGDSHHHNQQGGNASGALIKDDDLHPIDDPINSTCMRILVFEGEYSFVSANNTSIIINSSMMGKVDHPYIFHPDEYEYWNDTTLAICAKDLHEGFISRFSSVLDYVSNVSLIISVIFSFIHILLYLSLPKLRNLPGKNLFCLTLSLFVSQLIFLTLINHSRWQGLCVAASITMHYLFLAAFFWMSVMSFDIWRTFSGAVVLSRNQSPEGKQITFLKYNAFAWLTPLIIVTMALLVEFVPQKFESNPALLDDTESFILDILDKIRPAYGQNGFCWIGQRLSLFIFFAVPVALVITSNLILFSFTAKAILSQNKEAGKVLQNKESKVACAKKSSNNSNNGGGGSKEGGHHDEIKVKLYAKLALIMGLTWTLGFISNFLRWEWLWYPFVILNGLQGTFIFFAFDFKWKIVTMLKERYARFWKKESKGHRFGTRGRADSSGIGGTFSRSQSTTYSRTLSTSLENK